jgi:hypothetical protein
MVLYFWWFLFLCNRWGVRNSPWGSSTGGGLRSRTRGNKVQASTFGNGGEKLPGMTHDKVGQNECDAGCITPASGWWSLRNVTRGVAMKGGNLMFASVFFEILTQRPSIYRGFRLMISCACRALSPSFPIWQRFGFDQFLLRFQFVTALPARSAIQHGVGDDPVLGHSWATRERSQGRLGWADVEGFGPWPYSRVKTFSIFQTIFQFANCFEFKSNLNFERFLLTK